MRRHIRHSKVGRNTTGRAVAGNERGSRRDFLRLSSAGVVGLTGSTWLEPLARTAAADPSRARSCILLWMPGGPSQVDTFDLKPDHENGGPFEPLATSVPGMNIGEHLPKLGQWMHRLSVVRSMQTREGDHSRATYLVRTGRVTQGPIRYPSMGSVVARERPYAGGALPSYVSIAPYRQISAAAFGPGYLGPRYAPLEVSPRGPDPESLEVRNLQGAEDVQPAQAAERRRMLEQLQSEYEAQHRDAIVAARRTAYESAELLMAGDARQVFDLRREPDATRDAYGRTMFGQGCLLARRLVERGVPFVEVSLAGLDGNQGLGWDTHANNFDTTRRLCEVLDQGWATLMQDLHQRGLLDETLIVWMGEFGRTPEINATNGRDHFPQAWTSVLGGGGIQGGSYVGETSTNGERIEDRPVTVPDLLSTVCHALGLDPEVQHMSNIGRPIRLVDPEAVPLREILT